MGHLSQGRNLIKNQLTFSNLQGLLRTLYLFLRPNLIVSSFVSFAFLCRKIRKVILKNKIRTREKYQFQQSNVVLLFCYRQCIYVEKTMAVRSFVKKLMQFETFVYSTVGDTKIICNFTIISEIFENVSQDGVEGLNHGMVCIIFFNDLIQRENCPSQTNVFLELQ